MNIVVIVLDSMRKKIKIKESRSNFKSRDRGAETEKAR